MRKLAILGSTGSIGTQALSVVESVGGIEVTGIAAHSNAALMEQQARKFAPKVCALYDKVAADDLKVKLSDTSTRVYCGGDGIAEVIQSCGGDLVLNSLVGHIGILPTLQAIESGADIALANKETLVCAGDIVMQRAKQKQVDIIPVDGEHNALMQCICCNSMDKVREVIITASGGAFYGKNLTQMQNVTVQQALAHPTWSMGKKITIDCATMMNKGFEVIEANILFGVSYDKIKVIIHREGIVHAVVSLVDGASFALLNEPDMRVPIQYALTYPERKVYPQNTLDLAKIAALTFAEPDYANFPCLQLAYESGKAGGIMPAALCIANDIAVAKFMRGEIGFTAIYELVYNAIQSISNITNPQIQDIMALSEQLQRSL